MAAVAARIQERHTQLLAEQATLELTKAELAEIQAVQAQHVSINDSIHRTLLHVTRSRTGVELELFQARDQVHDYTRSIEQLQDSTEHLERETDQIHDTWKTAVETVYSGHELEMDLYQRALEETVLECEKRTTRRKNEWMEMETQIQRAQDETTRFHREANGYEVDIETMESMEQQDDEEVATLALNIREALSKVCIYSCLSFEYSGVVAEYTTRSTSSHICSLSLFYSSPHDCSEPS
jgi:chromosome segregation ATPase